MTYSLGREPTIEEIAGRLGTSREEVAASLEAAAEVESLYRPADSGDENSTYLMDGLAQDNLSLIHIYCRECGKLVVSREAPHGCPKCGCTS